MGTHNRKFTKPWLRKRFGWKTETLQVGLCNTRARGASIFGKTEVHRLPKLSFSSTSAGAGSVGILSSIPWPQPRRLSKNTGADPVSILSQFVNNFYSTLPSPAVLRLRLPSGGGKEYVVRTTNYFRKGNCNE